MALSVIVAGDFCPNDRVKPLIGKHSVFANITSFIQESDISIVNLECPVVTEEYKPIRKEGVNLCCSEDSIHEIADAGFSVITMANNHILDYGLDGLRLTEAIAEGNRIKTVGAGETDKEAAETLIIEKKEERVAIINCCEHEYSVLALDSGGANPLNPIQQFYAIQEARKRADYIIVIVHGGIEMYQLPTPRMKELYRFFIDSGADAVINHHQHCYSGYEFYNNRPIFYGIGNFCFDWGIYNDPKWNEGFLPKLVFKPDGVSVSLHPYIQCKESPDVRFMSKEQGESFHSKIKIFNSIIDNDVKLKEALNKFMDSSQRDYRFIFEPYSGRILSALYDKGLLPTTLNNKRVLRLLDYLCCESHFERVKHCLLSYYNNRLK